MSRADDLRLGHGKVADPGCGDGERAAQLGERISAPEREHHLPNISPSDIVGAAEVGDGETLLDQALFLAGRRQGGNSNAVITSPAAG